jgi:hypothetical protein
LLYRAAKGEGQYDRQNQSGFQRSQVIEVYKGTEEPRKIMSRTVEVNFDTCRGQRQLPLVRKVEKKGKPWKKLKRINHEMRHLQYLSRIDAQLLHA